MVDVELVHLDRGLPLPERAMPDDAGLDLRATEDVVLPAGGGRAVVGTGVALALPPGWAGFVLPRSGLAIHHGVTCLNAPGLIDSGYRDEIKVILHNTDPLADYLVQRGDRVAQLVVQGVDHVRWLVVDELAGSERGKGGLGHSGR
ncbi:MAG: dUTP diphosphatase [Acidimicrobiales bacterium]